MNDQEVEIAIVDGKEKRRGKERRSEKKKGRKRENEKGKRIEIVYESVRGREKRIEEIEIDMRETEDEVADISDLSY